MAKRRASGSAVDKRKLSLPVHVWVVLDEIAKLQTEAIGQMDGEGSYSVSNAVTEACEMYIDYLQEEIGPFPPTTAGAERTAWVKRLAASNLKRLREQLLSRTK